MPNTPCPDLLLDALTPKASVNEQLEQLKHAARTIIDTTVAVSVIPREKMKLCAGKIQLVEK